MDAETLKCRCGHLLRHHFMLDLDIAGNRKERGVCGMCGTENWVHPFRLDNLDYLEKLSE